MYGALDNGHSTNDNQDLDDIIRMSMEQHIKKASIWLEYWNEMPLSLWIEILHSAANTLHKMSVYQQVGAVDSHVQQIKKQMSDFIQYGLFLIFPTQ